MDFSHVATFIRLMYVTWLSDRLISVFFINISIICETIELFVMPTYLNAEYRRTVNSYISSTNNFSEQSASNELRLGVAD